MQTGIHKDRKTNKQTKKIEEIKKLNCGCHDSLKFEYFLQKKCHLSPPTFSKVIALNKIILTLAVTSFRQFSY